MTQTTVPQGGAPRALSLIERLTGPIFSPKSTFESVSAHPVWIDVLAICVLVSTVAWFAFLSTDVGHQAFVDQMFQQQEARGPITPEVEQRLNSFAGVMKMVVPVSVLVIGPIFAMVIAGVLYGVLSGLGVFDTLNDLFGQLSSASGSDGGGDFITAGVVFGGAAIIGAVNIVLMTALCTVGTFIYNLCSDLVGGLELTLSERD